VNTGIKEKISRMPGKKTVSSTGKGTTRLQREKGQRSGTMK